MLRRPQKNVEVEFAIAVLRPNAYVTQHNKLVAKKVVKALRKARA